MKHFLRKKTVVAVAACLAGTGAMYSAHVQAKMTELDMSPISEAAEILTADGDAVAAIITPWPSPEFNPNKAWNGIRNFIDPFLVPGVLDPDDPDISGQPNLNFVFPGYVEAVHGDPIPGDICPTDTDTVYGGEKDDFHHHDHIPVHVAGSEGMDVTFFMNGTPQTGHWVTTGEGAGGVTVVNAAGKGWSLSLNGDSFRKTWKLEPVVLEPVVDDTPIPRLTRITIEGIPDYEDLEKEVKRTAFDVIFTDNEPPSTPGSRYGRPAEPTAWPTALSGSTVTNPETGEDNHVSIIHSVYSRPLRKPVPPEGTDLYATLDIYLGEKSDPVGWDGTDSDPDPFVKFIADTDCVMVPPPDINAIPVTDFGAASNASGVQVSWTNAGIDDALGYVVYRMSEADYAAGKFEDENIQATQVYGSSMQDDIASGKYKYALLKLEKGDLDNGETLHDLLWKQEKWKELLVQDVTVK